MSDTEDNIRIILDSSILNPFGIRFVSIPRNENKWVTDSRIDEQEWDDTHESLLHMMEQEERDHSDRIPLVYLMPWQEGE